MDNLRRPPRFFRKIRLENMGGLGGPTDSSSFGGLCNASAPEIPGKNFERRRIQFAAHDVGADRSECVIPPRDKQDTPSLFAEKGLCGKFTECDLSEACANFPACDLRAEKRDS
jgi:hypothetical protein